jgi:hypothetical protein
MGTTMKMRVIIALLLLVVIFGLQVSCCQYAVKIEKIIIEREADIVSDKNLIH